MENNYICHSGGCPGSDMEWEIECYSYGIKTIAYSFPGHVQEGRWPKILNKNELKEGWEQVLLCEKPIKRPLVNIQYRPYVKNLLCRNWFQVKNSEAIYAIGTFFDSKQTIVNGGTGWAVQMAINNNKPIYFFDQKSEMWHEYNYELNKFSLLLQMPVLTKNFAGIGTREINEAGKQAIKNILKNTFMGYISDSKSYRQFMMEQERAFEKDILEDEITKAVVMDLSERAKRGIKKYNTTLGENNHQNMLQHMYEEALDFAQYLKKEITTLNTVQDLVKKYSNDEELGAATRSIYGQK